VNFGQTFILLISRHINRSNNEPSTIFFAIYFLLRITSSSISDSELCCPGPSRLFVDITAKYGRTSHPVNCHVLPENDPYVADAEKVFQSVAVGMTKEARLLDSIPWCICCHVILKPEN